MLSRLADSAGLRALGRRLPPPARAAVKRAAARARRPRWGNLRRTRPFSERWGFDRGTPVDRHAIEVFLGRHAGDVRGRVLEVADTRYTRRFGGPDVTETHVLDLDPNNHEATVVADLDEPDSLPEERFDCVVATQTLQFVADAETALANLWRALTPGGTLLVTVPAVSRVDRHLRESDRWRFTPAGLGDLLHDACPEGEATVTGAGNLTSAIAFLAGLAAEELRRPELDRFDPDFPILALARVRKPSDP